MKKACILIVDDEKTVCETLSEVLREEGYETEMAFDGEEAIQKIEKQKLGQGPLGQRPFDVVFCDLRMPKSDGLKVLEKVEELSPETFFIVITAYGSMETTLEALKKGAYDYVVKPLIFDDILLKLRHLLDFKKLNVENRLLKDSIITDQFAFDNVLGQGPEMKAIYSLMQKVAATQTTVLITGETGVGKERLAKAIHHQSAQKEKNFVRICCASYKEHQLDQALFGEEGSPTQGIFTKHDGTLFMDEIGDLTPALQLKLVKLLQAGLKSLRLIVSSTKDLAKEVSKQAFREDLYYRINVIELKVPPLRARKNDIPFLVKYFVRRLSEELGKKIKYVTDETLDVLMNYQWKGNIRELQNILERSILLSDNDTQFLNVHHLPSELISQTHDTAHYNFKEAMRKSEIKHIQWVLEKNRFDKKKTAQDLGLSLSSLYRKIEELAMPIQ
ncbi:MAG: sigma-54-dependent Fis family transcriptional regulator [Deltaproteobacteria bacterium]|nr:sigma-54-dependent Fis family transcriptional regulator [Deltaproteobacteria bacterium]